MTIVGITGHRILAEQEKIQRAIDDALRRIQKRFPDQKLRLMTQLAEGADRLVAMQFLAHPEWKITAVLPLPLTEYLEDFSKESRQAFLKLLQQCDEIVSLPDAESREASYEQAGRYVVDRSDVIICIWDGSPEQGRGGTGSIVEHARQKQLPLVWIHAGNREPGTLNPTTLGEEQGTLSIERF